MQAEKLEDYADVVELYLESQYYRYRAKERQAERERRQQRAQRWQPSEVHYIAGAAVAMAVSVVILGVWG